MIKITSPKDFPALEQEVSVPPLIKIFLKKYCHKFLREYNVESMEEFGSLNFLQSAEDFKNYKAMGLSSPLEESILEYCEIFQLIRGSEREELLHCCFVLSDSYAISVFVEGKNTTVRTKTYFLKEYIGTIKEYYKEDSL